MKRVAWIAVLMFGVVSPIVGGQAQKAEQAQQKERADLGTVTAPELSELTRSQIQVGMQSIRILLLQDQLVHTNLEQARKQLDALIAANQKEGFDLVNLEQADPRTWGYEKKKEAAK